MTHFAIEIARTSIVRQSAAPDGPGWYPHDFFELLHVVIYEAVVCGFNPDVIKHMVDDNIAQLKQNVEAHNMDVEPIKTEGDSDPQ